LTERLVEIAVPKDVRDLIKVHKGHLTYAQYFVDLIGKKSEGHISTDEPTDKTILGDLNVT